MKKYAVLVDVESHYAGPAPSFVIKCRWLWQAKLIRLSYLYGTAFMPLVGCSVVDAYILPASTNAGGAA